MTRSFLMTTSTIAALAFAPMAQAQSIASQMPGESPAVTEGGDKNLVGSSDTGMAAMKRPGIGIQPYEPALMQMSQAQYDALIASVGADFQTNDGEVLGVIEDVRFDAQGYGNLVVELNDETKIKAETLVVTLSPDAMRLVDGRIFLDTSEDELYLKSLSGSVRGDETRTTVIVM